MGAGYRLPKGAAPSVHMAARQGRAGAPADQTKPPLPRQENGLGIKKPLLNTHRGWWRRRSSRGASAAPAPDRCKGPLAAGIEGVGTQFAQAGLIVGSALGPIYMGHWLRVWFQCAERGGWSSRKSRRTVGRVRSKRAGEAGRQALSRQHTCTQPLQPEPARYTAGSTLVPSHSSPSCQSSPP